MDELCKIAQAHYQASSDDVQKRAHEFFSTMDRDGNDQVDLLEFLTFMAEEGYAQMTSICFFLKLDLDHNGTLDFWEVMALYYIVKSGRPFCDHCKHFIPGTYFTCVGCLEGPIGGSVHLCLGCYLEPESHHYHEGISKFLDNYSLLEAKIRSATNQDHQSSSSAMVPHSNTAMVPATNDNTALIVHNLHVINNYHLGDNSNPLIPERRKWKIALEALETAIHAGSIGAAIATCSIL